MTCEHESFACAVTVNRLEDVGRFTADVRVVCDQCKTPFRFLGLPCGLDLNGAAVSVDGTEARLAVAPRGEVVTPLEGAEGFTVRRAGAPVDPTTCSKCGGVMMHTRLAGYKCLNPTCPGPFGGGR